MADFGITEALALGSLAAAGTGAAVAASAKTPKPPPVVPMPDPNDPAGKLAKQRQQQQLAGEQGYQSTILTGNTPAIGSPTYVHQTFGQ